MQHLKQEFQKIFKQSKNFEKDLEKFDNNIQAIIILSHGRNPNIYTKEYRARIDAAKLILKKLRERLHRWPHHSDSHPYIALTGDPQHDLKAKKDLHYPKLILLSHKLFPKKGEGLNTKVQLKKISEWLATHHEINNILILTSDWHGPRTQRYAKKHLSGFRGKIDFVFIPYAVKLSQEKKKKLVNIEIKKIIHYSKIGDL